MMANFSRPCVSRPGVYTPQIGLNMGMDGGHGSNPPPGSDFTFIGSASAFTLIGEADPFTFIP